MDDFEILIRFTPNQHCGIDKLSDFKYNMTDRRVVF